MSQTIKLQNFNSPNLVERGLLDADIAAGVTSITVKNSQDLATNDNLYLERPGSETGESTVISGITNDTTVAVAATKFAHKRFDTIWSLYGTQARIYRASNVDGTPPANTDFALLTTISLDLDQKETSYVDSSGSDDYWYKVVYYNSTSNTQTDTAAAIPVRGGVGKHYASIEEIRKEAGLQGNYNITDGDVDEKRTAAEDEIDGKLAGLYTVPFTQPINGTIQYVTTLLAAGFLLNKDYGAQYAATTKEGDAKLKEARGILDELNVKQRVLVDAAGTSLAITGNEGFKGYPDDTTKNGTLETAGGERMFGVMTEY